MRVVFRSNKYYYKFTLFHGAGNNSVRNSHNSSEYKNNLL